MKIARLAFLAASVPTLLILFGTDASAQVEVGLHGTLADVRDVSPGIGGRVALLRPSRNRRSHVGLEVGASYYFPGSTQGLDLDAWGAQAVLLGRQDTGGRTRSFVGLGAKYVDVTASDGSASTRGDSWGFLALVGVEYGFETALSPFFEFGWSFMDNGPNIWEATLGFRYALSR